MKCLTYDMRLCKQSPAGGDMTGHELQDSRFGRDGVQSPKAPWEPSPLPSMEVTVVLLAGLPPACTRLQLCKIWLKQIPGNVKWGRRKTDKIQARFKTLELTNITVKIAMVLTLLSVLILPQRTLGGAVLVALGNTNQKAGTERLC